MKINKRHYTGARIALESAIVGVLGYALGRNLPDSPSFIALGLAPDNALGSIIDFFNRPKLVSLLWAIFPFIIPI